MHKIARIAAFAVTSFVLLLGGVAHADTTASDGTVPAVTETSGAGPADSPQQNPPARWNGHDVHTWGWGG